MREEVENLIIDGFAISSSEKGYKIIRDEKELIEAEKYLKKKAYSLLSRADKLKNNFHLSILNKQTSLF